MGTTRTSYNGVWKLRRIVGHMMIKEGSAFIWNIRTQRQSRCPGSCGSSVVFVEE